MNQKYRERSILIWLLLLFLGEGRLHSEASLLHTPQEVSKILEERKTSSYSSGEMHLQGLFYVTPLKWSVWVNGVLYDPTHLPDHFTIKAVTPEGVSLSFEEEEFFLRPNEVYTMKKEGKS